jgi:hypothetical protein
VVRAGKSGDPGDERRYASQLAEFLGRPSERLNQNDGGGSGRQYASFVFAEYLVENLVRNPDGTPLVDPNVIKETWEVIKDDPQPPLDAIKAVAVAHGTTLAQVLPEFWLANYRLAYHDEVSGGTSDVETVWRQNLAVDPRTIGDQLAPARPGRRQEQFIFEASIGGASSTIDPGGANYVELVPEPAEDGQFEVAISGDVGGIVDVRVVALTYPTSAPATSTICFDRHIAIDTGGHGSTSLPLFGCRYALLMLTAPDVSGASSPQVTWTATFSPGAAETFSRIQADGWGQSEVNVSSWQRIPQVASGNSYVDGDMGVQDLSFPYTSNDPVQYLDLGFINYPNEFTAELNMTRASGTSTAEGILGLRQAEPTSSSWGSAVATYVHWHWLANGDVQFWLDDWRGSGGSTASTPKTLGGFLSAGVPVRIRLRTESDWSTFKVWRPDLGPEPTGWDGQVSVGTNAAALRYFVAYAGNLNTAGVVCRVSYDNIQFVSGLP